MLKRIRIQKYKSLVDLELNLEPLTVILGPNASGKSNFLEVLQLLSRITSSQTLEDAFRPPYRGHPLESFTFGDEGIKSLLNMDKVSFSIEVDVELSPTIIESVNKRIQEIKDTPIKIQKSKKKLSLLGVYLSVKSIYGTVFKLRCTQNKGFYVLLTSTLLHLVKRDKKNKTGKHS